MDPEGPAFDTLLKVQFVTKAWPDIRKGVQKDEEWQNKPLEELVRKTQQIYVRRDEEKDWAGNKKPVGYLSKLLDPVSKGWPTCLQAIVAVALLVEEARKVTFGAPLVVYTPHNVRSILQQKGDKWLTDAWLLKYEAILIHSPKMELQTTTAQNPAQFLFSETLEKPTHSCAEIIELQTKIRPDLGEEEFEDGEKWFVDGSARVVEGKRRI
ncbi:hypothetical protein DUI87_02649 [Hirundo rustica rustica]|uniref:Reverse transcriptase RNase H-like domain-containing protein n=1 Tax=Hirundo rustica rustica TaxID=333673 RepID=A0A3M0LFS7_HIRRU|nr:hypothetical protein DUI87_02649 [Hirundo rustica rustica]